jgi:hypothetical protein
MNSDYETYMNEEAFSIWYSGGRPGTPVPLISKDMSVSAAGSDLVLHADWSGKRTWKKSAVVQRKRQTIAKKMETLKSSVRSLLAKVAELTSEVQWSSRKVTAISEPCVMPTEKFTLSITAASNGSVRSTLCEETGQHIVSVIGAQQDSEKPLEPSKKRKTPTYTPVPIGSMDTTDNDTQSLTTLEDPNLKSPICLN